MENQVQVITADALEVLNRSEIDVQISTAKRFPRNMEAALMRIQEMATMDQETAAECFYSKPQGNSAVEGLSVRMAEIIATNWGNLRAQARVVSDDGKTITAQGVCHDLETNVAICVDVKMGVTYSDDDKYGRAGKRFPEHMIVTTCQAACAKAFRNAVLKVVPKAVTSKVVNRIKLVAKQQIEADLLKRRTQMLQWFQAKGVFLTEICKYLGVNNENQIDADAVMKLHSLATAIKDGEVTIAETFINPRKEQAKEEEAKKKGGENASKVMASMNKSSKK